MLWLKTLNEEQWRHTDHAIENVWKCEVCDVLYEKETLKATVFSV